MADEVRVIRIEINAQRAVDGGKAAQRALEDIERNTGSLSRAMTGLESAFRSLFAGYLGVQGIRHLVETADAMTRFTNALTASGVAARDLTDVQDRLFAAANKHGIEIGAVGQLYSRLSMSSQELGASQGQMLKFVDGVTAALRVQGGSTQEASGALLQLSQAMGAGTIRAEEFTSILEGALPIAQAAARGIDGMEGSVAKLRAAVSSGKVSSQEFFQGLLRGFGETEKIAESTQMTMGAAATGMQNSWSRLIAEFDKTAGTSKMVVQGLQNISGALDALRKGTAETAQAWDSTTLDRLQGRIAEVQGRIDRLNARGTGGTLRQAELNRELAHMAELQRALADFKPPAPPSSGGQGYGGPEPYSGQYPVPKPDPNTGGGGSVASTRAQVDQIAEIIKRAEEEAQRLKEAFGEGTAALVEQNDVLAIELKLLGAAPDIRAKELAVLKATNEARKAGYGTESDAYKARLAALETGEKLRMQADELQRAQELWTEPLKQALRDIQSTAADAFDSMLESGNFSFEEMGKTFGRIVRRMAAEFLALATIRPVMSIAVQAIAPGMASSMGLGGNPFSGIGGGTGGSLGGFSGSGLGSLFGSGSGGLSSALGSFGDWLNTPFIGGFSGVGPLAPGMFGPAPNIAGAAGLTPLGALAGIGSIGMGAYSLFSGNGSPGSIVSGVGGIVGGGMSLAAGAGLIGSAFGPIGTAVGLLAGLLGGSGILDGLFGGGGYKMPPLVGASTQWSYNSALGGFANSESSQFGGQAPGAYGVPAQQMALFEMLGGIKDPSQVWGNAVWQNYREGQTTAYVISPTGSSQQWWQGSGNSVPWVQQAGAQSALLSIYGGAVGPLSPKLEQAFRQFDRGMPGEGTLQSIDQLMAIVTTINDFEKAMANLGETSTSAEAAIQAINDGLGSLWSFAKANAYDAEVTRIETFKEEQIIAGAKAFMAPFDAANDNPLVAGLDQISKARDAALKEAEAWNKALNTRPDLNVESYFADTLKITEFYLKAEKELKESYYQSTFGGLQSLVKSLTYGDLSGASPTDRLAGTRGAWDAAYAQAMAGDQGAIARLAGLGGEYARELSTYYGTSTSQFQTAIAGIRDQANGVIGANGGAGLMDATNAGIATMSGQLADIGFKLDEANTISEEDRAMMRELLDKLTRLLAKVAA